MLPTDLASWRTRMAHHAIAPSIAYGLARAADRERAPLIEVGYRLYWGNGRINGSIDVDARPEAYVVMGRHGSCDVVVDDERAVSLRHVLVRVSALDDGFPVLRVMDLQSGTGFELSDGSRQHSIAATGPLVFRIGSHSVVALPSAGRLPDALPVPLVESAERAPVRLVPQRLAVPSSPLSRITLLPASVDLARRRSVIPDSGPGPSGEGYELILESESRRAGVRFTVADLEHGVLIGRGDKCVDEGLRAVLGTTISRVHVLLIREHGACHLYDVASLVGTSVAGQRVRWLPLADEGAVVRLAARGGVTLIWRALSAQP